MNRHVIIGEKVRDDAPITYAAPRRLEITDFINVIAARSLKSVKLVVSGGSSMYTITLLSKGASRGGNVSITPGVMRSMPYRSEILSKALADMFGSIMIQSKFATEKPCLSR